MMRRRWLSLALVGAAWMLAACGGGGASDNGIAKLSATQALARVQTAVNNVKSVHVHGSLTNAGKTFSLDVHVGNGVASGSIVVDGGHMDLVLVNGTTYFRGDSKIFASFGANGAQATLASGKWIKSTGSTGPAASFGVFLDKSQLFSNLLKPEGTISVHGSKEINGTKALVLVDSSSSGGTLYVSETGQPLPLRVEKTGSSGGQVDFTDYNATVKATAPSGAIDISQLVGG